MIFVVEATGRRACAFFSKSTVPVAASTRIAEDACTVGGNSEGSGGACARASARAATGLRARPRARPSAKRGAGTAGRSLDRQVTLFGDRGAKTVLQVG